MFVICLDGFPPGEALDQVLAGIRSRLTNDPEEERVTTTEELRRLARGRLSRLAVQFAAADAPRPGHADAGRP